MSKRKVCCDCGEVGFDSNDLSMITLIRLTFSVATSEFFNWDRSTSGVDDLAPFTSFYGAKKTSLDRSKTSMKFTISLDASVISI